MNTRSNNGFLLGVLLIISILALLTKNHKSVENPQAVIIGTITEGTQYSSTMKYIYDEIKKLQTSGNLILTITPGKLPSPILGQTTLDIDDSGKIITAKIVLDIDKAEKAGDRLEPLLGHELKHVWDALFLYDKTSPIESTRKFISAANIDSKTKLYKDRGVESSAIAIEDIIRKELINSKNKDFIDMPSSRQAADEKYAIRSDMYPLLKSILTR